MANEALLAAIGIDGSGTVRLVKSFELEPWSAPAMYQLEIWNHAAYLKVESVMMAILAGSKIPSIV